MENNCCNRPYNLCEPLNGCPENILVFVPVDYPLEEIRVSIEKNPGLVVESTIPVTDTGYIELPLDEYPEGFFNPYSGPYLLQFFEPTETVPFEFTAMDGNSYSNISFTFVPTISDNNDVVLNAFGVNNQTNY